MDFTKYPEWTQGFIKSIEPHSQKSTIEKGDKLKVVLEGGTFNPVVTENSPARFAWLGSLPLGVFSGEHEFQFKPSTTTPGGTTLIHAEDFSGALSFLMKMSFGTKTGTGFEGFNNDLKRKAEGSAK